MKSICIDIGNSKTKIGIFENDKLCQVIKELSDTELLQICNDLKGHEIIASNVTQGFQHIYNLLENKERFTLLDGNVRIPIATKYKNRNSLGTDRLAAAVGGKYMIPNEDILVIQAGSCFTYDFIDRMGLHYGGGISPGLNMRFLALHENTGRLPLVEMDDLFENLIGNDTAECIRSGVIFGCIAELEGTIDRYKKIYPEIKVILTGGWANYFESKINRSKFAFHDLVLIGLNKILIYNNV